VFSDSCPEGQIWDISEGFPSDSEPYTEHYDYLSDSDLEDESSCSEDVDEDEGAPKDGLKSEEELGDAPDPQTVTSDSPSLAETSATKNDDRSTSFTVKAFPV